MGRSVEGVVYIMGVLLSACCVLAKHLVQDLDELFSVFGSYSILLASNVAEVECLLLNIA